LPESGELRQHVVEEPDRLGWRDRPVVDIPCHDDRVHPGVARHLDELAQHVALVLREVDLVEQAPEMPVGGVQESHAVDPRARGNATIAVHSVEGKQPQVRLAQSCR